MSGANSTPLGRMNPAIGSGKRSGSSLLNPSYMDSNPSCATAIQSAPPPSKHKLESSESAESKSLNNFTGTYILSYQHD